MAWFVTHSLTISSTSRPCVPRTILKCRLLVKKSRLFQVQLELLNFQTVSVKLERSEFRQSVHISSSQVHTKAFVRRHRYYTSAYIWKLDFKELNVLCGWTRCWTIDQRWFWISWVGNRSKFNFRKITICSIWSRCSRWWNRLWRYRIVQKDGVIVFKLWVFLNSPHISW